VIATPNSAGPYIISLDVGTSSVRSLLFDGFCRQMGGFGAQLAYRITTTQDGGAEVDADELAELSNECLSTLHGQIAEAGLEPAAVAFSAFWHSFLGVDANGRPTTPIIHLLDTRSAGAVEKLRSQVDERAVHQRTGCMLHTSYWPAKLLWLEENRASAVAATRRWVSFGEYLFERLFGRGRTSTSMASASGIWNQNQNDYDDEMLKYLPVERSQLEPAAEMDEPNQELRDEYAAKWPRFHRIPWFPSLGDGACNNLGSGCVTKERFALMVGTTGAMRAVMTCDRIDIPAGLWCYRVDRKRFVLGGALSNGGEVFAWMRRTLLLPPEEDLEAIVAAMPPGAHGLTVLPFFAGERSPYWRADLRGVLFGLGLATRPEEILRAALESVALRFRQIYQILSAAIGEPGEVVASGGALLRSPAWTQMMADALARPVIACQEEEASSRGAALLALERIGAIHDLSDRPARTGERYDPTAEHERIYDALLRDQEKLFQKLWT
jgi:gluconokinase